MLHKLQVMLPRCEVQPAPAQHHVSIVMLPVPVSAVEITNDPKELVNLLATRAYDSMLRELAQFVKEELR